MHKHQCKLNRAFKLTDHTEENLLCLQIVFTKYFRDNFAGSEAGYLRYKEHFDKLGGIGIIKGRGMKSITIGVLTILRGEDAEKLRALEKLCSWECLDDKPLLLEVRKR